MYFPIEVIYKSLLNDNLNPVWGDGHLVSKSLDEKFERAINDASPRILVIGCGGAGGNTISHIMKIGVKKAKTITVNTDAQDLIHTNADAKILIGRSITGGIGTGSNPEIGRMAAERDKTLLKNALYNTDMVFITCGLGGGTGTGAGPVIAKISKSVGALTVGVLTLPFSVEGVKRARNADLGLEKFSNILDSILIIPDDKLLEIGSNLSIEEAFTLADELLANFIKEIIEMVTKPGLINLDFADIKEVLKNGGVTMMGFGESDSRERAFYVARKALDNPLLEADISKAKMALVNIIGGPYMTLEDAESIVNNISDALSPNAQVTWGAQTLENLENTIKVMIIIPRVYSPWASGILKGKKRKTMDKILKNIENI